MRICGDVDVGYGCAGDETQVSYQSSTATLKDADEEKDGLDRIQRYDPGV